MDAMLDNENKAIQEKLVAAKTLSKGLGFNPETFEYSDAFVPGNPSNPSEVHTMAELHECLIRNKDVQIDGHAICANSQGQYTFKRINRDKFLETWKKNSRLTKMREAIDYFGSDQQATGNANAGLVGDDFVPLLGGPFNRQLYLHDALRMFALCFHAYHHDPVARAFINITLDFVLGGGFRVDAKHKDEKVRQTAQATWAAFEDINQVQKLAEDMLREASINGEILLWKLPNRQTKIGYDLAPGQKVQQGLMSRYRLIDPATIWEIVTYPEDITRVLFYQQVFPTQYQMFTGTDGGASVPGSKFITQQLPAAQVKHYKLNCVSNEKRGRSDLFPILGYLKRLRDSVNYSLAGMQKSSAWAIDTTIEGNQTDLDNYVAAQNSMGTIPPAGSEFVHTAKIVRQYLGNSATTSSSGGNTAFEWALNMACIGYGIPVSYLGTHLSGGQNRASALVGTEPVAKRFQKRQQFLKNIVIDLATDLMKEFGIEGVEWEVTFPEIITQDRSAKIKDIKTAEDSGYISRKRAAEMSAKELGIDEYNYETEKQQIDSEDKPPVLPTLISPLTQPGASANGAPSDEKPDNAPKMASQTAVTQDTRRKLSMNYGA